MTETRDRLLFELRWQRSVHDLVSSLTRLYGDQPALVARLKDQLAARWRERPQALKDLDLARDIDPDWFLSERNVGYVFYVDRFAGTSRVS